MHRFFVSRDVRAKNDIVLEGAIAHQIARVLRLRAGEPIVLVAADAADAVEWQVRLDTVEARAVRGTVVAERAGLPEPTCAVTLGMALLKGERFDWLLQKATELGVAAIQPTVTARTVRKSGVETHALERWRRIVTEAAEQSGRSRVPDLSAPIRFDAIWSVAHGPVLIAHEGEAQRAITAAIPAGTRAVTLLVGPEGGFGDAEVADAARHGAAVVSLGPRILRAETAGIAAVTLALAATENLQPPLPRQWHDIGDT